MPAEIADHGGAEGVKRGDAAVDVEIGLLAGGEGKSSGADGFFEEQGFEVGGGLEHGWILNAKNPTSNIELRRSKIFPSVACHGKPEA